MKVVQPLLALWRAGGRDASRRMDNPMNLPLPIHQAPRCTARSKRTLKPCRSPAMRGWTVCRLHGAKGGAPKGKRHGMYKHGRYTSAAINERRALSKLLRTARMQANAVGEKMD